MDIHSAVKLFPMDLGSLKELEEDINKHGQQVPIKVWKGQLLDGRRRLKACENIGIQPRVKNVKVDDPIAYVLSLNLIRRKLTVSQRSMIAARCLTMYALEAKERKKSSQFKTGHKPTVPSNFAVTTTRSSPRDRSGASVARAGKAAGVGTVSVVRAAKIIKLGDPELIAAVDQGLIPVATAVRRLNGDVTAKGTTSKSVVRAAVGRAYADKAVAYIAKIPLFDPEAERGIQIVSRCVTNYKQKLKELKNG